MNDNEKLCRLLEIEPKWKSTIIPEKIFFETKEAVANYLSKYLKIDLKIEQCASIVEVFPNMKQPENFGKLLGVVIEIEYDFIFYCGKPIFEQLLEYLLNAQFTKKRKQVYIEAIKEVGWKYLEDFNK